MKDVFLFIRHGWKSIWKKNIVWIFSSLYLLEQFFIFFQVKKETGLLLSFILLAESFISIALIFISYIGVPYITYCLLIGKTVTVSETLFAVRKFFGRVIGCSCLGILMLSPLLIWALFVSINNSTHTVELSNKILFAFSLLSAFTAVPTFTMVVFFENDWGIWKSVEKAWNLFIEHFSTLAILGLILAIIFKLYSALAGILTVLIQSGFDATSISTLNLLNPYASLNRNLLFLLLHGIGQLIFTPLSASIFISAYLKYNDKRLPSIP
jgi:hypothetical protein